MATGDITVPLGASLTGFTTIVGTISGTLGTATLIGGVIKNATIGTPVITNGTINNATLGTPTCIAPLLGVASGTALDLTVGTAGNDIPLVVTQNDTTNNPIGISLTNAGSGNGLFIKQDGAGWAINIDQNGDKAALVVDSESTSFTTLYMTGKSLIYGVQDISNGYGINLSRNLNEAGANYLATFLDDHTANTSGCVKVQNDGSGKGLFIDQNGNGTALYIDSEGTSVPGIQVDMAAATYIGIQTNAGIVATGGTITSGTINTPVIGTPAIMGGTISGAVLIGTVQMTGGTVANALIGTSQITGGTHSAGLIGTSQITGGTVNPGAYGFGTFTGATGTAVYVKTVNFLGTLVTYGTIISQGGIITSIN